MEKGLIVLVFALSFVLLPLSYAYELKTTETDPLEPFISALFEIQYKITGFAIIKPSTTLNTPEITKVVQQAQTRVQESIQSLDISDSHTYIYFGSKIIEKINSSNEIYFHSDHLGSTKLTTDSNGNRISENSYEPFGSDQINSNNKIKYTGKEEDSSNLYYYGARYYDPEIGRFTQIDPIFDPGQTTYAYANNNPVVYVDPNGRQALEAAMLMSAHGSAAGGLIFSNVPRQVSTPRTLENIPGITPPEWRRNMIFTGLSLVGMFANNVVSKFTTPATHEKGVTSTHVPATQESGPLVLSSIKGRTVSPSGELSSDTIDITAANVHLVQYKSMPMIVGALVDPNSGERIFTGGYKNDLGFEGHLWAAERLGLIGNSVGVGFFLGEDDITVTEIIVGQTSLEMKTMRYPDMEVSRRLMSELTASLLASGFIIPPDVKKFIGGRVGDENVFETYKGSNLENTIGKTRGMRGIPDKIIDFFNKP